MIAPLRRRNRKEYGNQEKEKKRIEEDAFAVETNRIFDRSTDLDRENNYRSNLCQMGHGNKR